MYPDVCRIALAFLVAVDLHIPTRPFGANILHYRPYVYLMKMQIMNQ